MEMGVRLGHLDIELKLNGHLLTCKAQRVNWYRLPLDMLSLPLTWTVRDYTTPYQDNLTAYKQ